MSFTIMALLTVDGGASGCLLVRGATRSASSHALREIRRAIDVMGGRAAGGKDRHHRMRAPESPKDPVKWRKMS